MNESPLGFWRFRLRPANRYRPSAGMFAAAQGSVNTVRAARLFVPAPFHGPAAPLYVGGRASGYGNKRAVK